MADGLSQLGKTADGLKPAYLTVTITGTDLANTDPLITYPHLQTVVLNDNRLTDIQSLGSLRSLTYVDVSKNKLTQVSGKAKAISTSAMHVITSAAPW